MKVDLIVRPLSAYFQPSQFFIAHNEELTVRLVDCGQTTEPYIQMNNKVYKFDRNKEVNIPSAELKQVNPCELQQRDKDGNVVKRWYTDNLFRPPFDLEQGDGETLETEKALLESVKALTHHVEELDAYVKTLETALGRVQKLEDRVNGKYTLLHFNSQQGE